MGQKYKNVALINGNLEETYFRNIIWAKRIISGSIKDERELYRQLKVNRTNILNQIEVLKFEVLELDTHRKELIQSGEPFWDKAFNGNWLNRFILFTNKFSSNYCQNFLIPIAWLFLSSCVFYFLILLSITDQGFSESINNVFKQFGKVFLLFNPAHNPVSINKEILNSNWGLVWDFLSRTFSSYFIFHIIRSLRKYTRK